MAVTLGRTLRAIALVVAAAASAMACGMDGSTRTGTPLTAEKSFAPGGLVEMELAGGEYEVTPSRDNRVRITTDEHIGDASVDVTTEGTKARVETRKAPNHFRATIEVPAQADLSIHLLAGELRIAAIAGNKDIRSAAGEIQIAVGNPDDYASVDATIKAGEIDASAFGGSKSGLMAHYTWSGPGKRSIRADLGAGRFVLHR